MVTLFLLTACVVASFKAVSATETDTKRTKVLPHVVMMLVDDNGWAGVGYNNP
jgi:hypothetical protein